MRNKLGIILSVYLCLAFGAANGVSAQEGKLVIELNKVEAADNECRLHFDVFNGTALQFRVVSADLVFFDSEGVMSSTTLVSFGRLHPNKHHFQSFSFPGVVCGNISRILVNDLRQCRPNGGEAFDCLSALSVSHKGRIELTR